MELFKRCWNILAFVLSWAVCHCCCGAAMEYPGIPRCDIYEVSISYGRNVKKLAVFQDACPAYEEGKIGMTKGDKFTFDLHKGRSISWAGFDLKEPIVVTVTIKNRFKVKPSATIRILPSGAGIAPQVRGNIIKFRLNKPGQYSVEIGSEGHRNGLMLFADPPEAGKPGEEDKSYIHFSGADPDAVGNIPDHVSGIYFRRGRHDIGIFQIPQHVTKVYIERGAWVDGAFRMVKRDGVKIFGRGILSSRKQDYRSCHGIEAQGGENITVHGITVAQFKHFAVRLIARGCDVAWVKTIGGWSWNMDGISVRDDSMVKNCFIWANDDAIKPYRHRIVFEDIVVWQLDNGGLIQMSWGNTQADDVIIRRVTVLHAEWDRQGFNRGLINMVGHRYAVKPPENRSFNTDPSRSVSTAIRNWLIEEVVCETEMPLIFSIDPYRPSPIAVSNLTIRNCDFKMKMGGAFENRLNGFSEEQPFSGLLFDNVRFNGEKLTARNWQEVTGVKTKWWTDIQFK